MSMTREQIDLALERIKAWRDGAEMEFFGLEWWERCRHEGGFLFAEDACSLATWGSDKVRVRYGWGGCVDRNTDMEVPKVKEDVKKQPESHGCKHEYVRSITDYGPGEVIEIRFFECLHCLCSWDNWGEVWEARKGKSPPIAGASDNTDLYRSIPVKLEPYTMETFPSAAAWLKGPDTRWAILGVFADGIDVHDPQHPRGHYRVSYESLLYSFWKLLDHAGNELPRGEEVASE